MMPSRLLGALSAASPLILSSILISTLAVAGVLASPAVAADRRGAAVATADMERRVAPCTLCHGAQGRSSSEGYYPRIAGKPATYLFNQLVAFRDGGRRYEPMRRLLVGLDDAYLHDMAVHFAEMDLPYPAPQVPEARPAELELGRTIATRGIDGIVACATCHGERLTGVEPAIPGLLGLPRDYINAQIGAWREGQRHAGNDDCMADVARSLDPGQVRALSNWLAAQRVPADASPDPGPPSRDALGCGVVERAAAPATARGTTHSGAAAAASAGTDAEVAAGAYLARIGNCTSCHTRPGGAALAGGRAIETPFGTVYSTNLTSSDAHGIGRWNADEFRRAMREGVSRDGRVLSPAFPYTSFTRMTDRDIDALFAYLQTIAPVEVGNRPNELRAPYGTSVALRVWRAAYLDPGPLAPDSSRSDAWNRGAYLSQAVAHCDQCHSPRNRLGGQDDPESLRGGRLPDGWHAPNLRDAAWTAADGVDGLAGSLRTGMSPSGWASGPMAEIVSQGTSHLSVDDALAIATYLVEDAAPIERPAISATPGQAVLDRGARIYRDHCADCHGDAGTGRPREAPPLAGNPGVRSPVADNVVRSILEGGYAAQTPTDPRPHGMPPYAAELDDAAIAAVATYVRHAWGNGASPVDQPRVSALRAGRR